MSIQVRDLTHIYNEGLPGEQLALDRINFDIFDGEIVSIIGHTGSGKSTLVQHLNGLLKPNSGHIIVGNVDITAKGVKMRDIRRRVGLVFQYPEYQLFEETVYKDIAFGPKNLELSDEEIDQRVREAIELVGLDFEKIKDRSPFELSGGQKRRVAIAGILAMKPQVLILDEPTAGLDPGAHMEILDMIKNFHRQAPEKIIIMVTHNMDDVVEMSDKVIVMDRGRMLTTGTPGEVFLQKKHLENIGLDVPPVTELMYKLKEKLGNEIRSDILTEEEALSEILKYLKGENQKND